MRERLWPWALLGGFLAMAGLPIYIHAPKAYADLHGVNLAALGLVLLGLRALDVVQDPGLGWCAARLRRARPWAAWGCFGVMSLAMFGLFTPSPPLPPLLWFAVMLSVLFSAFSLLTILFYSAGVARAGSLGESGHIRLARWRESGALIGISLAALLPALLAAAGLPGYAGFALVFTATGLAALWTFQGEWAPHHAPPPSGFRAVLRDGPARLLLLIALVNAAPVAITSTLFLFFTDARLGASEGFAGAALILFFIAAAGAAPLWGALAERLGARRALALGMVLSVISFGWAMALSQGDQAAFLVICVLSGAALGADMTLLPALFARRLEVIAPGAAEGFGLWSFVSKLTLALAAGILLPMLHLFGVGTDEPSSASALMALSVAYAGIPCGLKLIALALVAALPAPTALSTTGSRI